MNVHLRPNRSPSLPPSSSRLPNASAYAVTIHSRLLVEKCSARCADGSAIFTIVESSTTISCAVPSSASTAQRLGSARACGPGVELIRAAVSSGAGSPIWRWAVLSRQRVTGATTRRITVNAGSHEQMLRRPIVPLQPRAEAESACFGVGCSQMPPPGVEIERKFPRGAAPARSWESLPHEAIDQGYLALDGGGRGCALRRRGERAYLTVKVRWGPAPRRGGARDRHAPLRDAVAADRGPARAEGALRDGAARRRHAGASTSTAAS